MLYCVKRVGSNFYKQIMTKRNTFNYSLGVQRSIFINVIWLSLVAEDHLNSRIKLVKTLKFKQIIEIYGGMAGLRSNKPVASNLNK